MPTKEELKEKSKFEQEGYEKLIQLCIDIACEYGGCKELENEDE
jgi:hypothetical protein